MLALATLTRPGPFRSLTHTMGRFFGVREGGILIAMAGERLHTPGFHEITAVCTHPDHRGRGLGAALMRKVGARMLDEGDQPFLHTYANNATAVGLYRRLGFDVRTEVTHAVWKR
jgi:predicted GNAT family acetyltransferase